MSCINFVKHNPHEALRKFIDYYYVLGTGPDLIIKKVPLFAHAGSDVLINCSDLPLSFSNSSLLIPGKVYMGGAATAVLFVESFPNSTFVGVRFKPGGLSVFYRMKMIEISNQMIEFQDHHFCGLIGTDDGLANRLDQFYLSKCTYTSNVASAIDALAQYQGNISVNRLASECNISQRSLERLFEVHVGVSPKEYINIVRFQRAINALGKENASGRLQQIAYEFGYYDLAHFANDIKKHSGLTPSKIPSQKTRSKF